MLTAPTGCWQLLERGASPAEAVALLVLCADMGFRSVDTADIYGQSEAIVGAAQRALAEKGKPPLTVATKFVSGDLSPRNIKATLQRSCTALGRSPNLVQLHVWDYEAGGFVEAAQELAQQTANLGGDVGVTNFDVPRLTMLLDAGVKVASNQVQYSLLDRRPEAAGMLSLCARRGVRILAYGAVAGGLLSSAWVGRPKPGRGQLATSSLRMYMASLEQWSGGDWNLFQELLAIMGAVAARHNASIANVAVRYVLDSLGESPGGSVILGVRSAAYLDEALHASSAFRLTPADLAELRSVADRGNPPAGDVYHRERGYCR